MLRAMRKKAVGVSLLAIWRAAAADCECGVSGIARASVSRLLRIRSRASSLLHRSSSGAGSAHSQARFLVWGEFSGRCKNCRSELARDLARSDSRRVNAVWQALPGRQFHDCCAADREQAHSYIDRRLARNLRTVRHDFWSGANSLDAAKTVGVSLLAIWREAAANRCMRCVRHYRFHDCCAADREQAHAYSGSSFPS